MNCDTRDADSIAAMAILGTQSVRITLNMNAEPSDPTTWTTSNCAWMQFRAGAIGAGLSFHTVVHSPFTAENTIALVGAAWPAYMATVVGLFPGNSWEIGNEWDADAFCNSIFSGAPYTENVSSTVLTANKWYCVTSLGSVSNANWLALMTTGTKPNATWPGSTTVPLGWTFQASAHAVVTGGGTVTDVAAIGAAYAQYILTPVYAAMKAADPSCTVVACPTTALAQGFFAGMESYAPIASMCDAVATHPNSYGIGAPQGQNSIQNYYNSALAGSPGVPVWATEWTSLNGSSTTSTPQAQDIAGDLSVIDSGAFARNYYFDLYAPPSGSIYDIMADPADYFPAFSHFMNRTAP